MTCKKTSATINDTNDPASIIYNENNSIAKIPLGPCSYDENYSMINNVPICGPDSHLWIDGADELETFF